MATTLSPDKLSPQQLTEVIPQLEKAYKTRQAQFEQLRACRNGFKNALDSMTKVHDEESSKTALVPLSSSIYQEAELLDKSRFIVDIGAGYYVERGYGQHQKYLLKRMENIGEVMKKVQEEYAKDNMKLKMARTTLSRKLAEHTNGPSADS